MYLYDLVRKNKFLESFGATNTTNLKQKNKLNHTKFVLNSTKYDRNEEVNYNFTKKKREDSKK